MPSIGTASFTHLFDGCGPGLVGNRGSNSDVAVVSGEREFEGDTTMGDGVTLSHHDVCEKEP